jgi:hypothetical protein
MLPRLQLLKMLLLYVTRRDELLPPNPLEILQPDYVGLFLACVLAL